MTFRNNVSFALTGLYQIRILRRFAALFVCIEIDQTLKVLHINTAKFPHYTLHQSLSCKILQVDSRLIIVKNLRNELFINLSNLMVTLNKYKSYRFVLLDDIIDVHCHMSLFRIGIWYWQTNVQDWIKTCWAIDTYNMIDYHFENLCLASFNNRWREFRNFYWFLIKVMISIWWDFFKGNFFYKISQLKNG